MFSIPWSFPLDKYLLTYWKVKVSENVIFLRYFQNLHLQVWVRCGCAKPFFQKFSKSSKILEYFPYLDHFHSTKTRWLIGRSKSVKNPYFSRGGLFWARFRRFLGTRYWGPMIYILFYFWVWKLLGNFFWYFFASIYFTSCDHRKSREQVGELGNATCFSRLSTIDF